MKTEFENSPSTSSPIENDSVLDESRIQEEANSIEILDEEGLDEGYGEWEDPDEDSLEDLMKKIPILNSSQIVTGPVMQADSWTAWKTIPDSEWEYLGRYLVNGREKLVGTRRIAGEKYVVYWCLNDAFVAQRYDGDVGRDLHVPEEKPSEKPKLWGPPPPSTNEGAIRFRGRNFKLAGLRKWQIVMPRETLGPLQYLCDHQLESRKYKVFEAEDHSFVAFPIEDDQFLV